MKQDGKQPVREKAAPVTVCLPLSTETIRLDSAGARTIARIACQTAAARASAIESDKRYAMRYAAFLTGTLAAQCTSEAQRMTLFEAFLRRVRRYLEIGCSDGLKEAHEWAL